MKLNPPYVITWWIAVIIGVLGILGTLTNIPIASEYSFLFVAVAFILLALATLLRGL